MHAVQEYCREILAHPDAYVDYWNLEEEEGATAARIRALALELCEKVDDVLLAPFNKRGSREW